MKMGEGHENALAVFDEATEPSPPEPLVLPPAVQRDLDETDQTLGTLGHPFDRRNPFFVGLVGALGVAVAYVAFRGIAHVTGVLLLIGLSLFIAIGLNPIIAFLMSRSLSRGVAVGIVTFGFLLVIAAFILVAIPPISHEIHVLTVNYPKYKSNVAAGRGWAGKLAVRFHLVNYFNGRSQLKVPVAGGILGAGRILLSASVATISVISLTIYFLIALPGVTRLWLSLISRSRRERVRLLTEEVYQRVGGSCSATS